MRVYYDSDADLNLIKGKKVAVVGYGSQGHAHLLNMRDSGVKEIAVALRAASASAKKAEAEGIKVVSVPEAAKWADVVMMLTPDELQADIYREHLAPHMKQGAALMFAHGLNVHFNLIEPRSDLDVLMVAPKGPGHTVRSEYRRGGGVPCLVAIAQDASGNAHDLGLFDALRALAQRHRDFLDAGVAQIERMGMALAAIADDGVLLALDQVQVGIAIVIDTHGLTPTGARDLGPAVCCREASRFCGALRQARKRLSRRHGP